MFGSIGVFKVIGIFVSIILLVVIVGGAVFNFVDAAKTGDWSTALKQTGGKLFSLDYGLREETKIMLDYIPANNVSNNISLSNNNNNSSNQTTSSNYNTSQINHSAQLFHLVYSLSILLSLFALTFFIFKLGLWISGAKQMNPLVQLLIIVLIIGLYFVLEFLYTQIVLKETIIPLKDGVWYYISNLPKIVTTIFGS